MTDLCYLGATDASRLFAAGDLSPVELLDAVLARRDVVEPQVNAYTEDLRDQAREQARASERRHRSGTPLGPLDGVPVALKDEHTLAGRLDQQGSLVLRKHVATQTHPVVERLRAAGAVLHGRTTTPEFSCMPFTHSRLWGVTRNPWNLEWSPGGSSGGSGAALAAGTTTLATGSDIGGSIRLPSSFCGLVGFKPPHGRVATLAPWQQESYAADGPMGRSVADVAAMQNVLAGPDPRDPVSLRPRYVLPEVMPPAAGARVAIVRSFAEAVIDPAVDAGVSRVADVLRDAGVVVEEAVLPWTYEQLMEVVWGHFALLFGAMMQEVPRWARPLLMPYSRVVMRRAKEGGKKQAVHANLEAESRVYEPLGRLHETYDAVICPSFAGVGLRAGVDHTRTPVETGDTTQEWDRALLTAAFNIVGRVPVLNVPSGLAANDLPTGVQIVGRTYDDVTVFRLGAAIEDALGFWSDPAWRPAGVAGTG